jgi:hypothetical protein
VNQEWDVKTGEPFVSTSDKLLLPDAQNPTMELLPPERSNSLLVFFSLYLGVIACILLNLLFQDRLRCVQVRLGLTSDLFIQVKQ